MKVRLYLDEDSMDRALVRALTARAVDVKTALDADMIEKPDESHLDFATGEGRVLYSFNAGDFYRIHTTYLNENKTHAGIVLSRQQEYSVGEQMRRLLKLVDSLSAEEMRDRVEFLSTWG